MEKQTVKGVVTANDDPAGAGRIKVALSSMDGQEYPLWIESVALPGWFSPPENGDTVEVEVPVGGDLTEFPDEVRYKGNVLDEFNPPPTEFTQGAKVRGYWTKGGHLLIFDDTGGDEKVSLVWKGKIAVVLTKDGVFLGTDQATEPFVLGNVLKAILETVFDAVGAHIHTAPAGGGPTTVPDNAATYTTEKGKLPNALSEFIFGQRTMPT